MPGLHIVLTAYLLQPPMPSHLPSRPQVDTGETGQDVVSRAGSPTARLTQVPSVGPGIAQVLQPSVQATLQQTPSAQWPLPHWASQLQASPIALGASPAEHGGAVSIVSTRMSPGGRTVSGMTSMRTSPPSGLLLFWLLLQAAAPAANNSSASSAPAARPPLAADPLISLGKLQ